jgi:hypothetical protein
VQHIQFCSCRLWIHLSLIGHKLLINIMIFHLNYLLHTPRKWPVLTMYWLMILQITLVFEWFINNVTSKWPHPCVDRLMTTQVKLLSEWFITRIMGNSSVPNTHVLMHDQMSPVWMAYYTLLIWHLCTNLHITLTSERFLTYMTRKLACPHYVTVDASWDYSDI